MGALVYAAQALPTTNDEGFDAVVPETALVTSSLTCDASAAPENGAVGDCTNALAVGSTCQPTCNSGYTVSGASSCAQNTVFTFQGSGGGNAELITTTLTPAICTSTAATCTRTYEGGCGNWGDMTLNLNFYDKTYTVEECHDLCKANSECGGVFVATASRSGPGCLLVKAGFTDDNNVNWDYYAMSDCTTSG